MNCGEIGRGRCGTAVVQPTRDSRMRGDAAVNAVEYAAVDFNALCNRNSENIDTIGTMNRELWYKVSRMRIKLQRLSKDSEMGQKHGIRACKDMSGWRTSTKMIIWNTPGNCLLAIYYQHLQLREITHICCCANIRFVP
ncbi:uncharacterized protein LOC116846231 isoform X2 [Odontomachus brunneus]|uniref:uncharacterized protein LOC116846231 isoform X2 n=1 Tax=Odontomachus brunneus TaxID=486640 RepID=UPI0013F2898C|nr:uncharacterized protein LOC116846231 isoform X2 [Odontomachus brunneus]